MLADIGSIADWNPGVVHSEKTPPGEINIDSWRRCNLVGRIFGWLMVRHQYRKGMRDLLRGLKEHVENFSLPLS